MYLYLIMQASKKIMLMVLFFATLISCSQKKLVSTTISFTQQYCGGARPSAEILAEAEKPKAYANKTIVILSSKGKTDSVKTNADGLLKTNLKPGNYKLMEAWRYYKKANGGIPLSDFDKDCLKEEWKKEIKEIVITKKDVKIFEKNVIIEICPWNLPCILESKRPPMPE